MKKDRVSLEDRVFITGLKTIALANIAYVVAKVAIEEKTMEVRQNYKKFKKSIAK